jgi:RNA polymerase sigma factor (sigma-70 family)
MEWQGRSALMTEYDEEITATILRERARLSNFIRRRVGDSADADDLLQDVLYEFIAAYHLPASIEHASAWLFRVARNRIIDFFRRRRRQSAERLEDQASTEDEDRLDLWLPAPGEGPEAAYVRSAVLDALQTALDELAPEQRAVFLAHEIDGTSFKEMAAKAGVSVNTLLARKRYAVSHLRNRLRSIYEEFEL